MDGNPLIEFLRSYGPNAASDSLYDEHVQAAARKHGVEEIRISAPLVDELGILLAGDNPTNVILTGTAGDGKTYHIRQVFVRHLGGRPEDWPGEDLVISIPLANGRELRVIRDLSELSESTKATEIDHITRCLAGEDDQTIYLVAANDGQLLQMWRTARSREDSTNGTHDRVYRSLSRMLREEVEEDSTGFLKLRMYNLSRRLHPGVVEEAINAVLGHPMWDDGCQECELFTGEKLCPIRVNRRLLKGRTKAPEHQVFRIRLRDVIELASANDQHAPLRQILTLVVNIVLGDSLDQDAPLLTCTAAKTRAESSKYDKTNPYDNAVGANLAEDTRSRYTIFSTLEGFGIGLETTNQFDEILLHGDASTIATKLEHVDPWYGRVLFAGLRAKYVNDPKERIDLTSFARAMTSQRRRLFFQLPENTVNEIDSPWLLTAFHNGADYLEFRRNVAELDSGSIVSSVKRRIVKGINRALTGMMTDDMETLWLAGTIGRSDDPTGRIFTIAEIRCTQGKALFHLNVDYDQKRRRPQMRVVPSGFGLKGDNLVPFDIRPLLFEYLLRVAEGSLPSTFSRQCHQEVKHFAMRLRQQIARLLETNVPASSEIFILSLGSSDASIRQNPIEVTDQ